MQNKFLLQLQKIIATVLLVLTPLFFLPITGEYSITNKFYLISFITLFLCVLFCLRLIFEKKITFLSTSLMKPLLLFALSVLTSIIISAPNKLAALFLAPTGVIILFSFIIFTLLLTQITDKKEGTFYWLKIVAFPSVILAILKIVFYIYPKITDSLTQDFQFLKNPLLSLAGNQIELVIFLGFVSIFLTALLITPYLDRDKWRKPNIFTFVQIGALVICSIAFILSVSTLWQFRQDPLLVMVPFSLSWSAAVETLKTPLTAIFGVGPGNFLSIFTAIKPVTYNMTPLWSLNFNLSHSTILQIWSEFGLLGLIALLWLTSTLFKQALKLYRENKTEGIVLLLVLAYSVGSLILFPPMIANLLIFFTTAATIAIVTKPQVKEVNLSSAGTGVGVALGLVVILVFYFLGRSYIGEFYFKKSGDTTKAADAYRLQQMAANLSSYNESYHRTFSQLNLNIGRSIAGKKKVTDSDRSQIAFYLQKAVDEGKAALNLNRDSVMNWANLADVYRNMFYLATGADGWAIEAYQGAISADPNNPLLKLNLGGIYYEFKNFEESSRIFKETVALKPNWANAYYNLAWSLFNEKKYDQAQFAMQQVVALVQKNSADYKVASSDLKTFSMEAKKAEKSSEKATPSKKDQSSQQPLQLPTPPVPKLSPPVELPTEPTPASPAAKPQ